MKAFLCLPVAILALSVSGCASDSSMANNVDSDSRLDQVYIAKVERVSRDRGVVVRWVNPPVKKKAPEQARPK